MVSDSIIFKVIKREQAENVEPSERIWEHCDVLQHNNDDFKC